MGQKRCLNPNIAIPLCMPCNNLYCCAFLYFFPRNVMSLSSPKLSNLFGLLFCVIVVVSAYSLLALVFFCAMGTLLHHIVYAYLCDFHDVIFLFGLGISLITTKFWVLVGEKKSRGSTGTVLGEWGF